MHNTGSYNYPQSNYNYNYRPYISSSLPLPPSSLSSSLSSSSTPTPSFTTTQSPLYFNNNNNNYYYNYYPNQQFSNNNYPYHNQPYFGYPSMYQFPQSNSVPYNSDSKLIPNNTINNVNIHTTTTNTKTKSLEELKREFKEADQGHIFDHVDGLSSEELRELCTELSNVNLKELKCIYEASQQQAASIDPNELAPPPRVVQSDGMSPSHRDICTKSGLQAIAANQVAVVLMAGGQATRLGVSYPKGMLVVGSPSQKSLFQIQCERLVKVKQLAAAARNVSVSSIHIPFYIMTSTGQTEEVEQFFAKSNYWGLPKSDIRFFEQCTLPCVTPAGKIIMSTKSKVARAPDGHGGLYKALGINGVHTDMIRRGIKHIYCYCVDNILVRVADPLYIGYCMQEKCDFGYKVVAKAYPKEPAGVVCVRKGIIDYVEYSELPDACCHKTNPDGTLTFNAANILNLYYSVDFLVRVINHNEGDMAYHVAKKKIPSSVANPPEVNGWKFEKFVLDCTPAAKNNVAVLMVPRDEEFSPIKNGWGAEKDSPDTALIHLTRLHKKYIVNAGGEISHEDYQDDKKLCEVSSLVSFAGEGLEKYVKSKSIALPVEIK